MSVAASLFFCAAVSSAHDDDTKFTSLVSCGDGAVAKGDPSIISHKKADADLGCGIQVSEITYEDTHYGFLVDKKTLDGVEAKSEAVEPAARSVFETHKPCRRVTSERAYIREWLVPQDQPCGSRPTVWRVFTAKHVCLMPGNLCFEITKLTARGRERVEQVLGATYSPVVSSK